VTPPEQPVEAGSRERRVYSVGDLLRGLRALVEDSVGRVWVAGETSNLYAAQAGHHYFTLKDGDGQIRCALFRNDARRLPFELENGLELLLLAEPSIYEVRGELQLIVREVEPRGEGALQLAFEQLRRRLEAEGLFDESLKRPLPTHPRRIGLVTSPGAAALRDVIQVSGRRWPSTPLLLSPTRVQGDGAELEIAAALRRVVEQPEVDVVLVVRGGGSLEDLWCFNTEPVVRAIAGSPVPIVSGVGHETDFSLADLAADHRAPTPSAAAMLALPDREALRDGLSAAQQRLLSAARGTLAGRAERLERGLAALRVLAPSARLHAQQGRLRAARRALWRAVETDRGTRRLRVQRAVERLSARRPSTDAFRAREAAARRALSSAIARNLEGRGARLATLAARLDSLSPLAVLGRGYAVARRSDTGRIIEGPEDIEAGESLVVRVARAHVEAKAISVDPVDDSTT
jgi:exodeoxyribonuclease VII large subunit